MIVRACACDCRTPDTNFVLTGDSVFGGSANIAAGAVDNDHPTHRCAFDVDLSKTSEFPRNISLSDRGMKYIIYANTSPCNDLELARCRE